MAHDLLIAASPIGGLLNTSVARRRHRHARVYANGLLAEKSKGTKLKNIRVKHTRVEPWLTLPVALGNTIQIGGLLGGVLLARRAGKLGRRGTSSDSMGAGCWPTFVSTPLRTMPLVGLVGYALPATGYMVRHIHPYIRQGCAGSLPTCRF